jgi:hypothetical protein
VQSGFFARVHITAVDQADLLLEALLPAFAGARGLLTRRLYKSVGLLFVFRPRETLNLFSHYVSASAEATPEFWDAVRLFLGLWPLFADSALGDCHLGTLAHVCAGGAGDRVGVPERQTDDRFGVHLRREVHSGGAAAHRKRRAQLAPSGVCAAASQRCRRLLNLHGGETINHFFLKMTLLPLVRMTPM